MLIVQVVWILSIPFTFLGVISCEDVFNFLIVRQPYRDRISTIL